MKKFNPRYFSLKKIDQELDLINRKILECYERHSSFQEGINSISKSMKNLHDKKSEIRIVLNERKRLTKNLKIIAIIQKLMKK